MWLYTSPSATTTVTQYHLIPHIHLPIAVFHLFLAKLISWLLNLFFLSLKGPSHRICLFLHHACFYFLLCFALSNLVIQGSMTENCAMIKELKHNNNSHTNTTPINNLSVEPHNKNSPFSVFESHQVLTSVTHPDYRGLILRRKKTALNFCLFWVLPRYRKDFLNMLAQYK